MSNTHFDGNSIKLVEVDSRADGAAEDLLLVVGGFGRDVRDWRLLGLAVLP